MNANNIAGNTNRVLQVSEASPSEMTIKEATFLAVERTVACVLISFPLLKFKAAKAFSIFNDFLTSVKLSSQR